ncbi:hypothetical protein B4102_2273 [Heyndrickxia sporothermodurans]|uniref:Uncharacterized protein n=1 Tax=Heyndrickxia sporothermodurans TaxID=46224 RepID=A0A150LFS8_9BACI|nr:hypothetical protein B4102_2273 [Heyndrickxia sporothermodurans]
MYTTALLPDISKSSPPNRKRFLFVIQSNVYACTKKIEQVGQEKNTFTNDRLFFSFTHSYLKIVEER